MFNDVADAFEFERDVREWFDCRPSESTRGLHVNRVTVEDVHGHKMATKVCIERTRIFNAQHQPPVPNRTFPLDCPYCGSDGVVTHNGFHVDDRCPRCGGSLFAEVL